MAKASTNNFPGITFVDQGLNPTTPTGGNSRVFTTVSGLFLMDDVGAVIGPFATTASEGGAMTRIGSPIVLASPAPNFDFTSIPSTYNHLKIIIQARGDTALGQTDVQMRLNNDGGANYDNELLNGINTTASASNVTAGVDNYIGNVPAASATAGFAGSLEIVIFNYARTTFYKNYNGISGSMASAAANALSRFSTGQWRNTAAVSRVTLVPGAGNFDTGSVATLYGIY
jgi:hypothetical protein